MAIYKYQRITTAGPNGTTLYFTNADSDPRAIELAEVAGWFYVFVPDTGCALPSQRAEISWQLVTLDTTLLESIKASSRFCHIISDRMQQMIRGAYSLEDELYYARIGLGSLMGIYTYQTGEQAALQAYGTFVESVRQWGRDRRAEVGLT